MSLSAANTDLARAIPPWARFLDPILARAPENPIFMAFQGYRAAQTNQLTGRLRDLLRANFASDAALFWLLIPLYPIIEFNLFGLAGPLFYFIAIVTLVLLTRFRRRPTPTRSPWLHQIMPGSPWHNPAQLADVWLTGASGPTIFQAMFLEMRILALRQTVLLLWLAIVLRLSPLIVFQRPNYLLEIAALLPDFLLLTAMVLFFARIHSMIQLETTIRLRIESWAEGRFHSLTAALPSTLFFLIGTLVITTTALALGSDPTPASFFENLTHPVHLICLIFFPPFLYLLFRLRPTTLGLDETAAHHAWDTAFSHSLDAQDADWKKWLRWRYQEPWRNIFTEFGTMEVRESRLHCRRDKPPESHP